MTTRARAHLHAHFGATSRSGGFGTLGILGLLGLFLDRYRILSRFRDPRIQDFQDICGVASRTPRLRDFESSDVDFASEMLRALQASNAEVLYFMIHPDLCVTISSIPPIR